MLKRLTRPQHGHRVIDERALALNLSFVLHERSDSAAVRSAVRAVRSHASVAGRLNDSLSAPVDSVQYDDPETTQWITATIGVPHLLADALSVSRDRMLIADSDAGSPHQVEFFRAPASLHLPSDEPQRVGVAALVLRPDRKTSQLIVSGVHDWPVDHKGAIRSLERLIQAHAGQWMPRRALWSAPAESLLPDEVY